MRVKFIAYYLLALGCVLALMSVVYSYRPDHAGVLEGLIYSILLASVAVIVLYLLRRLFYSRSRDTHH